MGRVQAAKSCISRRFIHKLMAQEDSRNSDLVFAQVQREQSQDASTRLSLLERIESELKRPVVTLFTSFRHPLSSIDDSDLSVLEELLRQMDAKSGVAIMISSPGGSALAAERIIHLLRAYSGTGEYWAIVPSRAKSAATMVCLGASKIIVGPASELGPIDPQMQVGQHMISVHHVIDSYERLFEGATKCPEDHRLQPFMQQLQNYDDREISYLKNERDLSTDIAIRCLKDGMMKGVDEEKIKKQIEVFLFPTHTKSHGRPIYPNEAKKCGLKIEIKKPGSSIWNMIYEFYVRADGFVSNEAMKSVESGKGSFYAHAAPT